MEKFLCLLLAIVLLLSACGSDTAPNATTPPIYEEGAFDFMPSHEVEAILNTMTPEQRSQVEKLLDLYKYCKVTFEGHDNICSSLIAETEILLERRDQAKHALLSGLPLLMEVEFNQDAAAESTVPTWITLMCVDDCDAAYPYPNYWVGLDVSAIHLSASPGDCLTVNGDTFTVDETGTVTIPVENGQIPDSLEIGWICGDLSLVALVKNSESNSESTSENTFSEAEPLSDEERNSIIQALSSGLSRSQSKLLEEINLWIDAYQQKIEEMSELIKITRDLKALIESDLASAENTLLNGLPFYMNVYVTSEDPGFCNIERCFLMATPEGEEPGYTYPNPWEGYPVVWMNFAGYPEATLTINGVSFIADENGIVEVPTEKVPLADVIELRWEYNGLTFNTVLGNSVLSGKPPAFSDSIRDAIAT